MSTKIGSVPFVRPMLGSEIVDSRTVDVLVSDVVELCADPCGLTPEAALDLARLLTKAAVELRARQQGRPPLEVAAEALRDEVLGGLPKKGQA
jgi:hypothetical protein